MSASSSSLVSRPFDRAAWPATLALAFILLALRLAYLIWICPYELAADEAQYWDWSRRLALSYYSKGPGVAWIIAASTWAFGVSEWAVRLPAAVASFVATLALARLAARLTGGDERVGFVAAVLYQAAPVFYATSQFMTIDAPYFACWIVAAAAGWRIAAGRRRATDWLLLGAALGVGVLFKYTILLLAPGVFAFLWRRSIGLSARQKAIGFGLVLAALLATASPVFVWNARHGWPTVAHLMGNAGLPGGDVALRGHWVWNPLWTLGYCFYPFVVLGPAIGTVLVFAFRERKRAAVAGPALAYALYAAIPVAVFYLLVSFATDIKLNWPVGGYILLLIPAADWIVRGAVADRRARVAWRWLLGVGVVCAVAVSFAKWPLERFGDLRIGERRLADTPIVQRVSGHRAWAARVARYASEVAHETGQAPFFVAKDHADAALLAFYAPSHPVVFSAGHLLGGRESAYDYFADTCLADPSLLGRPAVLVGAQAWHWTRVLHWDSIERAPLEGRIFAGHGYGGPVREPQMP